MNESMYPFDGTFSQFPNLCGHIRSRRYEKGHWDAVITDYKEIELPSFDMEDNVSKIIDRTRRFLLETHLDRDDTFLPPHAIDLKADGGLHAHVDSVRFSGGMVAGISLLSSSIMRLKPSPDGLPTADGTAETRTQAKDNSGPDNGENVQDNVWVDLLLPPLSLYVLTGVCRYRYSHELLESGQTFEMQGSNETTVVDRERRISVIFRDAKKVNED